MKVTFSFLACLGALLCIQSTAFADSGWTEYSPVSELTPTNQGRFLVKLRVSKNPSQCTNNEIFYRDYGATGSEQMFRVLLEALASGKRVRVYVTGRCELNGYSEISSVSIVP